MKVLAVYSIEQAEKWDAIVRSFREHDVYWLSGYVMRRDVAKDQRFRDRILEGQYYDFATPYGYGGWIIEGENTQDLFVAYKGWLRKKGIICEFIRFHPMLQNQSFCASFYEVIRLGEVVHMDISSPEVIWSNITSKNRNMIRKR